MAGESNWTRGNFKKTSNDVSFGVRSTGSLFHSQPAVRHFNDGGLSDGEWARGENYGDGTTGDERVAMARDPNYKVPAPATTDRDDDGREKGMFEKEPGYESKSNPVKETKKQSFGEAFKAAENGSTFEWNGKMYKKEYASPAKKELRDSSGKSFAEDVADRKAGRPTGDDYSNEGRTRSSVNRANENYGNEGRRSSRVGSTSKASTGRGVIDTSDLDPNTLLPRRKS